MVMRTFRNGRGPVRMVSRSELAWRGALAVVLGLIAVVWPGITLGAFVILFAVCFFSIFYGTMSITQAAQHPHEPAT